MQLFNQLLNLHSQNKPIENFFTEIIAYFFSKNTDILLQWLKSNLIIVDDDPNININTQIFFGSTETYSSGSKPDITVELIYEDFKDVIFIESKIGSSEGQDQLMKYAKTLKDLHGIRNKHLIYITRDYEPKILIGKSIEPIHFLQLRWYHFYQYLRHYKTINYVPEILDFMKGNNMALNNQFSSIDLMAMSNFRRTLFLMEATLNDEVKDKMNQLFGTTVNSFKEFRQGGRFILYHLFFKNWNFWCSVGYFDMKSENYVDYPTLGFYFEVSNKKFPQRANIIKAMEKFSKENAIWEHYNLHDLNAWAGIFISKSMKEVLSEEDHIKSITKYFLLFLENAERFKKSFPELPWENPPVETTE